MTKYIFLFFLSLGVFNFCKKPIGDDLAGELQIKGRLVLIDSLKATANEEALGNNIIKITTDSLAQSFLYQVETNSEGYFNITNLSNKRYYLFAEKRIGELLYSDTLEVFPHIQPQTLKMILYPAAPDFNLISFLVNDGTASPATPIYNASICLFSTKKLADEGNCDLAIWRGTTDKSGIAQINNLAMGRYYISSSFKGGMVELTSKDSIDVALTGIKQFAISLASIQPPFAISGGLYINDTLSGYSEEIPLSAHPIFVKKESEKNKAQYLHEIITSANGAFSITGIIPGTYSLQAMHVDNVGILYADTISVNAASYQKMVLYPTALHYNVLQIIVRDSANGGLINNAKVCIYSSRMQAQVNDCTGSLQTGITNRYGRFTTTRLSQGKYFVNAHLSIGDTTLLSKDSVELNIENGIFQTTILLK